MIHNHRAVDDLIFPVIVDISDAQTMVSLPCIAFVTGLVAVKRPQLSQLAVPEVVSGKHRSCVIAARHNKARPFTVQIGDACQKPVHAVAVSVSPVLKPAPRRIVIHGCQFPSRFPVKNRQIFRPVQNSSIFISVIGSLIADHPSGSVNRSVSRLHGDFRFSVAVKIIDHQLGIMGARADVFPEMNPPHECPVKLIGIDDDFSGIAVVRVIFRIGRVPFEHNFVFSVAVKISDARVIGAVRILYAVRSCPAVRLV